MADSPLIIPLPDAIFFLNKEIKKLNKKIKDANTRITKLNSIVKVYPDAQIISDKRYDDRDFICSKSITDTLLFEVENDGIDTWILPYKILDKEKVYYDTPKFSFWTGFMGSYKLNGYYKNLLSHGFSEELCKACDKYCVNFLIKEQSSKFDTSLGSKHLKEMLVFL